MDRFGTRWIEFAVPNARAGGHTLNIARTNDGTGAQTVFVFQGAANDVADDFHVAVWMRAEAAARGDTVVVNHSQGAEAHLTRIVVIAEGKRVVTVEPVDV